MHKWVFFVSVVAVTGLLAGVLSVASPTAEDTPIDDLPHPGIAAHRGFKGINPENTMPAFRDVAENHPNVAIEFDVRELKDGTLVISHEPEIDDVSAIGATGKVKNLTTADWKKHKVKHPSGGPAAPAAFLSDVLDEFGGTNTVLMPELKKETSRDAFIDAIWPYRDQAIVQTFNVDNASVFVRTGFRTVQLTTAADPDLVPDIWAVGHHEADLKPALVAKAHEAGAQVWVWGDDLRPEGTRLLDMGVDGFIADYPGTE